MARSGERARLPGAVVALGLVSLFTDVSSEMIFPLLPAFLAARVGAAPVLLGAMEGLADLVAAGFKWWSGRWADRSARLRPLVLLGYTVSAFARPWMSVVGAWWHPLVVRVGDRIGKGVRGAPRDAMIAAWAPPGERAAAFGFQRAMDHAGAALGASLAAALVALGIAVDRVFLLSAIPGALGVLVILFAREPRRAEAPKKEGPLEPLPRRLAFYLGPVALFTLTNATDAFLLLRLSEQGAPAELLPLAWLALHAVKAAVAYPAGALADRIGSAKVVFAGWTMHALAYVALALSSSVWVTFGLVAMYGLYHAFAEGAEKGLLADLAPEASRGRAFGLYHALTGIGALVAGVSFGALWHWASSAVAFLTAAAVAVVSAALLRLLLPRARAAGA